MKKLFYLCIMLMANNFCNAQNIVPNGSFEQFIGCPNFSAQIDSLLFWFNPSIGSPVTTSTPDYFNSCAANNIVGVPKNFTGFQYAHFGSAYSGISLFSIASPEAREYIEVPLNSTLIANNCYQFEMYICLANMSRYKTNEVGVYFSDTIVSNLTTSTVLPFIPQINNSSSNVFDTLNWTAVSGTYIANGGENYLIIGNFKDDANTPFTINPGSSSSASYVLIDDVSLISCLTSLDENDDIGIEVYPNPFNEEIKFILKSNGNFIVNLYDVTGRIVLNQSITNKTAINTLQLAKGIYFYEVINNKKLTKKGKVIKN